MHEGFVETVPPNWEVNKAFGFISISRGASTHIVVPLLALLCNLRVLGAGLLKKGEHLLEVDPPSGTIHVGKFGMDVNGRFWWESRVAPIECSKRIDPVC